MDSKSEKKTLTKAKALTSLFVSLLLLVSLSAGLSYAVPTSPAAIQSQIHTKMVELERVKAELASLDTELEITVEAYNKASYELDLTEQNLISTRANLDAIESDLKKLKEQFRKRIRSIYKQGEIKILHVLLNTNSFADLLSRISFLLKISQQDAIQVKALHDTKIEVEKQKMRLETLRLDQMAIQQQLEAKKQEIQQKLVERQQFLSSLDTEIQLLIQMEKEEQTRIQATLHATLSELIRSGKIQVEPGSIVFTALKYLGVPYVWAGSTPAGFDCSGLMMYIFAEHGVTLPHYSGAQFKMGTPVLKENLLPGDLVFFGTPVYHVGLYIGGGYFVHASGAYDYVRIDILNERRDYAGARRIPLVIPNTTTPTTP